MMNGEENPAFSLENQEINKNGLLKNMSIENEIPGEISSFGAEEEEQNVGNGENQTGGKQMNGEDNSAFSLENQGINENGALKNMSTEIGKLGNISSLGTDEEQNVGNGENQTEGKKQRKCCRYGCAFWCKKYFWEGQDLSKAPVDNIKELLSTLPWRKRIMITHRRLIGFLIPTLFYHFFYWGLMIHYNMFYNFVDKWPLSVTMVVGSMIAGGTSVGGGAVAFPVMTLALNIRPSVARDVATMIQGSGMTCASFTIFFMHVRIEWHTLIYGTLGGIGGVIFGLNVVDPALSPAVKKLGFVSIWFAFAGALIIINRVSKRRTFKSIQNFNWWKLIVIVVFGFVGGTCTSFAGGGIDICTFSMMTLLFRVSEKVATPTSVILMAFNSLVCIYWRGVMQNAVELEAWEYQSVVAGIVTIGAPVGSVLGTHFHRLTLAVLVIILNIIALITAFVIVPLTPVLIGGSVGLIIGCFLLFMGITLIGGKMMERIEKKEKDEDKSGETHEEQTEEQQNALAHRIDLMTHSPSTYQLQYEGVDALSSSTKL